MLDNTELIKLSAREAVRLLKAGDVTPMEMVDAAAERIKFVDRFVNALPTLCIDEAREQSNKLEVPKQTGPGWLAGLLLCPGCSAS